MKIQNVATTMKKSTQSLIDAYTAELQRKLEVKLNFINSVAPILEKYQENNEMFTAYRLGVEIYGDAYKVDRTCGGRAAREAMSMTARLSNLLHDLIECGAIERVEGFTHPSASGVYRVK